MTNDIVGRGWAFPPRIGPQGTVLLTNERNELDEAIGIILRTPLGRRVMRPTFGCRLHELIFAPNNNHTAVQARRYVEDALGMWEPRISVENVTAKPDQKQANRLIIHIEYRIKATRDRRTLVYPFYLIPEE